MPKPLAAVLPVVALLAACGGKDNAITTTNTENVILNDQQSGAEFRNDDPSFGNDGGGANAVDANATDANIAAMNGA
jgi:hypothetical protein